MGLSSDARASAVAVAAAAALGLSAESCAVMPRGDCGELAMCAPPDASMAGGESAASGSTSTSTRTGASGSTSTSSSAGGSSIAVAPPDASVDGTTMIEDGATAGGQPPAYDATAGSEGSDAAVDPYACDAGGCNTSCAADADCTSGYFCWEAECVKVAQIGAGNEDTCALTTAGGVQCWGYNYAGELGNDSKNDSYLPVAVTGLSSGISAISVGRDHTCALTTEGGVECWGNLGYYQSDESPVPVVVAGLSSGVSAISAGEDYTCALTTSGAVQCWGYNYYGELGNNSTNASYGVPVAVTGLSSGVSAIAAGESHACALMTAGGVQCWGDGLDGDLGNGLTAQSDTPVAVASLSSDISAIAAGGAHTCALTTSGGVQCWGDNQYGQLGNDSTINSSLPVPVMGLSSGVSAIAAGLYHTCALTMSGGVLCWGDNEVGELGNESTTNSSVPAAVMGLSSRVTAIAAGFYHTCALTTSGGVECWGINSHGELGNNSTINAFAPTAVVEP